MPSEAGAVQFETDLFISHAHIDDQPLSPEQLGWISRFHTSLGALLSMRLGRKARIWRDPKLQGNDVFGDEIVEQFSNTAVLVSVITLSQIGTALASGVATTDANLYRFSTHLS